MTFCSGPATSNNVVWSFGGPQYHPEFRSDRTAVEHALRALEEERTVHNALGMLDESELKSLLASMDEAAQHADERATDRIAERVADHAEERTV